MKYLIINLSEYCLVITAYIIVFFSYIIDKGNDNISKVNSNNNNNITIGNDNNNDNKNIKDYKHKYVKILVNDPFNNREILLKISKKQKGVYV